MMDGNEARYAELAREHGLLGVLVSPFYRRKVEEEAAALGHRGGPLCRMVLPGADKVGPAAPGETPDFVRDADRMPPEGGGRLVRKYADRLLVLAGRSCFGHCLYCCRQDLLAAGTPEVPAAELARRVRGFLAAHPEVREVILSGGDPLTLGADGLGILLAALDGVEVRVHTRAAAYAPAAFDAGVVALLAGRRARVVHHLAHPYEVCAEVRDLLARLGSAGLRQYNQLPLLRKVNDHERVLGRLARDLDGLGVRTLSVYFPEPVLLSSAFRLGVRRMLAIADAFGREEPSWAGAVRFCLDSPWGKVDRAGFVGLEPGDPPLARFRLAGRDVLYPDLPAALDEPGDLRVLLWRG